MQYKNIHKYVFTLAITLLATYSFAQNQNTSITTDDTTIYTMLPTMPTFGVDESSLQAFITKESKYPASTFRKSTSKSVFVQIIIEKDGKVTFDKIAHSFNEKYDEEAIRIVKNMPNWIAGKLANGNLARMKMIFPIWFE